MMVPSPTQKTLRPSLRHGRPRQHANDYSTMNYKLAYHTGSAQKSVSSRGTASPRRWSGSARACRHRAPGSHSVIGTPHHPRLPLGKSYLSAGSGQPLPSVFDQRRQRIRP